MTRRKRIIVGILLALLLCVGGTAGYITYNWSRWTPVQIGTKYSLEDIGEDQTVLAIWCNGIYIAVDKEGKWKYIDWDEGDNWCKEHEDCTMLETYDAILAEDDIPYQCVFRAVSKPLLKRAINIEGLIEMKQIGYDSAGRSYEISDEMEQEDSNSAVAGGCIPPVVIEFYAVTGRGENRELVLIGEERYELRHTKRIPEDIRIKRIRRSLERILNSRRDCSIYYGEE